jgi:hypothetical protein
MKFPASILFTVYKLLRKRKIIAANAYQSSSFAPSILFLFFFFWLKTMRAFRWTHLLFSTALWRKHQMTYRLGPLLPGGIFLRPITATQRFQNTSSLENDLFF